MTLLKKTLAALTLALFGAVAVAQPVVLYSSNNPEAIANAARVKTAALPIRIIRLTPPHASRFGDHHKGVRRQRI